MITFLKRLVTWWDGQTIGTQIFTARHGEKVGTDAQGNIFYRSKDDKKRWVIFNGEVEASRVDAEWHGWLHHTWDTPPDRGASPAQSVGKAASAEPHRHACRPCARRIDPACRARGARRLRGMAPRVSGINPRLRA